MNIATTSSSQTRRAVSPYARRLAREKGIALDDLPGTGPTGRIVAADVLAYQAPATLILPEQILPTKISQSVAFSATVSLVDFFRLAADAARVGMTIDIEDAALRAARTALAVTGVVDQPSIALEVADRQILISGASDLSIGTERRLRLEVLNDGGNMASHPATASLLVLRAARVMPVNMPIRPGRALRIVLVVDTDREEANALLCANADRISETQAVELLSAFVLALEEPLALLA